MSLTFVTALVGSAFSAGILAWLVFVSVPPTELGFARTPDGRWIASEVPIAERAWFVGVRSGMEVEAIQPPDTPATDGWTTVLLTDGFVRLTVQRTYPSPDSIWPVLTITSVIVAGLGSVVARSLAWWLLLVPAIVGVAVASDDVPAAVSFLLALAPPSVGALSVTDRVRRLGPRVPWIASFPVILVAAGWLLAYALRFDSWAAPRQLSAAVGVCLLAFGTAAVVRDALLRARTTLERAGVASRSVRVLVAATLDELIPGRARTRLAVMERERAALATDLHGDVLPTLTDVIRSVEAGMSQAEAAARLRLVAHDLRELMTVRRLVVLEELGLVAALEWLAERVEERTNVTVVLDVQGDPLARVAPEAEMHAYRIAQQALDNALVHARPSEIRIAVDIASDRLVLSVTDDGAGIASDAEARAIRAGRLGLADMRQRAAIVGATLSLQPRDEGGTTLVLRWPA